jgi:hypothetical protein
MISKAGQVVLLKNSEILLCEDGLSLQEPGVSEIEKLQGQKNKSTKWA